MVCGFGLNYQFICALGLVCSAKSIHYAARLLKLDVKRARCWLNAAIKMNKQVVCQAKNLVFAPLNRAGLRGWEMYKRCWRGEYLAQSK